MCVNRTTKIHINSFASDSLYLYKYIVFTLFMFIIYNAEVICLSLNGRDSYRYAIASDIVINIVVFSCYGTISDTVQQIKTAMDYLGQGGFIDTSILPVVLWVFLNMVIIGLSVWGFVLLKNDNEQPEVLPGRNAVYTRIYKAFNLYLFMKQYNFQGRYWKPSALSTATVDTKRKRPDGKLYCFINIS